MRQYGTRGIKNTMRKSGKFYVLILPHIKCTMLGA
jgi:hypothetical protein